MASKTHESSFKIDHVMNYSFKREYGRNDFTLWFDFIR